jgi:site-specific recombinase XerD
MKVKALIQQYLKNRRALGAKFERTERQLNAFCNAVGNVDIKKVDPALVKSYLYGTGALTINWRRKYEVVKGFYRYAISRGHVTQSPLPTSIPVIPQTFEAYTFSSREYCLLLKAIDDYGRPQNRFTSLAYRTLRLLLFNTGMRIGEALSLTMADVNLSENLITVRDTKFFKTRLVPISSRLSAALSCYMNEERRGILPENSEAAFFIECNGRPYGQAGARSRFRRLCNRVKIRRPVGSRYQPRLHDIRHTFAITRLLKWYKEGADVQRLLPHLSTYLGHIDISSTQRYLAILPELLSEAGSRFERYALGGYDHV